jgi:hypothetical protein
MVDGAESPDGEAPERGPVTHDWRRLPPPVPRERTVATSEASPHPEEKDDYWREVEWMLRVTGGS